MKTTNAVINTQLKPVYYDCTVAEAMDAYWGKRCPDHHTDCPACKAWDEYDDMVKNYQEEGH